MPKGAAAQVQDGLPVPRRHWAMVAIWLTLAPSVINTTLANVALPLIAKDFHAEPADAIWIVNAYQLVNVVSMLPLAALGEIIGYRRVFKTGTILFTIASVVCTQAHSLPELAMARAFQGLGAACIVSVNGAMVRHTFPSSILGRGIGFNAVVIALSSAIGPTVASAVLVVGPWQWLFALSPPLGVAALIIGWKTLPVTPTSKRRLDPCATLYNIATFLLAILGIGGLAHGGNIGITIAELVGAAIAGTALVRRSLSQDTPLVPIDLLRNPMFSMSVVTSMASFVAQGLAFVSLPFYFIDMLHRSQVEAGLLMTPWPAAVACMSPFSGRLTERYSALMLSGIGSAILLLGLCLLAFLPTASPNWWIGICTTLCGIGFSTFQTPNNKILLSSAPLNRSGAAGGMLGMARLTGQTLGASLTAVVFRLFNNHAGVPIILAALFAGLAALLNLRRYLALNKAV